MSERRKYIDLLKLISAFCIVALHVNSNSLHKVQNYLDINHLIVANAAHQLLYVAVPVFMLLTGAGMFGREIKGYKDIWPNIRKILICIVFFGSVFELSRIVIRHENISALQFIVDVLYGNSWSHMWFLSQLLGIYLLAPVLCLFLKKENIHNVWILTGIGFSCVCLLPFLLGLTGISCNFFFPVQAPFFVYICLGYLIEHTPDAVCEKYRYIFTVGAMAGLIGIVLYTLNNDNAVMTENNPITFFCAAMLVYTAKAFVRQEPSARIIQLSKCSLGVYIIHPALIHIWMTFIQMNPQLKLPFVSVSAVALLIFAASLAIVYLFIKIKIVLVGLMLSK